MPKARPNEPKPPKRSAGFNLDSITGDVTNFLSGYSTVQVRNGSQSILAVRADANAVNAATGATGGDVVPTQINKSGVVSLQGTDRQITTATKAAGVAQKIKAAAGLSTGAWVAIAGGGLALLVLGGGALLLMRR